MIGRWAHAALEAAIKSRRWPRDGWDERLDDLWDDAWQKEAGDPTSRWARQPGTILIRATIEAWLADEEIREAASGTAHAEVPLTSSDDLLAGRVDVVLTSDAGRVEIWDLKTAEPGRSVTSTARMQLELYAGLFFEAGHDVVRVGVIGSTSWAAVPADTESCAETVERFRGVARALGSGGPVPAEPAVDKCLACPWLGDCDDGRDMLEPFSRLIDVVHVHQYPSGTFLTYDDADARRQVGPVIGGDDLSAGPAQLVIVHGQPPRVFHVADGTSRGPDLSPC